MGSAPPQMKGKLAIHFAGVGGSVEVSARRPLYALVFEQIQARYRPFASKRSLNGRHFRIRVTLEPTVNIGRSEEVTVRAADGHIEASRWNFGFHLAEHADHGRPFWSGVGWTAACEVTFDSLLRALWSVLLFRLDGFLIHSCGLLDRGSALVFPGRSGAGKSTLAAKAARVDDVLSDDMVAIRRDAHGAWTAYATPFWGDRRWGRGTAAGHPLECVGFLEQAKQTAVRRIPPSEAATRLTPAIVSFQLDRDSLQRTLGLIDQFAHEVRCFQVRLAGTTSHRELFREMRARH